MGPGAYRTAFKEEVRGNKKVRGPGELGQAPKSLPEMVSNVLFRGTQLRPAALRKDHAKDDAPPSVYT